MRTLDETELQRVSGGWVWPGTIIWSVNAPPPQAHPPTSVRPAPPPKPVPNPGFGSYPVSF